MVKRFSAEEGIDETEEMWDEEESLELEESE